MSTFDGNADQGDPDREARLEQVLAAYIEAADGGRPLDRQQLLATHVDLAADLEEFFANRDQMVRVVAPLHDNLPALSRGTELRYLGDYELLECVAAGGMGVVYKARQLTLNRIVAVKMILAGALANPEDIQRFRAESEMAASLQHPGIVPIYEVGVHEGQHYFSMEFIDGQSLADLVRKEPCSAKQSAEYVRTAAETVQFAHEQGTLHRDLKPSNMLLDQFGRLRITDFGLAKRRDAKSDLTHTGQTLGTPAYMPPEQATGNQANVGPRSDVYSLGAVLYELLTGRPPFRAESAIETLKQVESLVPASPRLLTPTVPRDLETICLKCLEKEPHRRYESSQQLADDLGRFLRGEPIAARPISHPARLARWCRRNPAVAALTGAAAALLLLTAGGALLAYWRESKLHSRAANLTTEIEQAYGNVTELRSEIAVAEQQLQQAQQRTGVLQGNQDELEKQRRELTLVLESRQQKLYSTLLYLAQADWEAGEVTRADDYLDDCPRHLRDGRWERLKHLCHPKMRSLAGTACAAISTDGRYLATVRWRTPKTNQAAMAAQQLANPNPSTLGSTSAASVAGPVSPSHLPHPSFQTGAETQITFINRTPGEIKLIWIDADNEWHNYRSVAANEQFQQHTYAGHAWLITDTSGRHLAACEAIEGGCEFVVDGIAKERPVDLSPPRWDIVVLDLADGELVCSIPIRATIEVLRFQADSHTLISGGSDALIQFWDIESGELRRTLAEHSAPITCLSLSSDGRRLASASDRSVQGKQSGEIILWNLDDGTVQRKLAGSGKVALDPAGLRVAFQQTEVRSQNGEITTPGGLRFVAFDPADDAANDLRIRGIFAYEFSPQGSYVAVAGEAGSVEVWDVADQRRLFQFQVYGNSHVAFSPDETRLAYAVQGNSKIRDRSTESLVVRALRSGAVERILPWYASAISAVAFLPDGRSLATADDQDIKVWDVTPSADPTEEILADIHQMQVGPRDWPQWGGSRSRVNTPAGDRIPSTWDVGEISTETGRGQAGRNIKWVANLGSQTYGNPVVANGKVFVGTNNAAGYLRHYPPTVDLGVLLCFDEGTGDFLWQHSNEKLPTGRVHDWPLQGVCSTPAVDGDRLWYVTNRGEVVCLDVEGFADGEDDGPLKGLQQPLFEFTANLALLGENNARKPTGFDDLTIRSLAATMKIILPGNCEVTKRDEALIWDVTVFDYTARLKRMIYEIDVEHGELRVWKVTNEGRGAILGSLTVNLTAGLDDGQLGAGVRGVITAKGFDLSSESSVETIETGRSWRVFASQALAKPGDDRRQEIFLRLVGTNLVCYTPRASLEHEADVVWSLDMIRDLGVSPHNMSNCSPLIAGDFLFVCTSNGVDESHTRIPAPDAPSFIALDRWTGKVLWTDKSPGNNIQHAQWASPSYGVFAGEAQVIFPGGDGWVYSFDPRGDGQGNSKLLWKFDGNFKESRHFLGGRSTRNEIIAFPAIYDKLVYIVMGQDPEHGEGSGCLWCLDPAGHTGGTDVSESLAVDRQGQVIPYKPIQAVNAALGEHSIPNPRSAVVWRYTTQDRNGDGVIVFEEEFHRSISAPVIKDDILYVADFAGLTGQSHVRGRSGLMFASFVKESSRPRGG